MSIQEKMALIASYLYAIMILFHGAVLIVALYKLIIG